MKSCTLKYAERNGFKLAEERLAGWPERDYFRRRKAHLPGLILVGETWGIDPFFGEGITPAMQMAAYGAQQVKWALDHNRFTIPRFKSKFLLTEEGWNLYFHDFLAARLYGKRGKDWLTWLFEAPGMKRLASSGKVAYGRIARAALPWAFTLAVELVKHAGLARYHNH